ncbi:hypothetical protein OROMI_009863 [Orobanche minor]
MGSTAETQVRFLLATFLLVLSTLIVTSGRVSPATNKSASRFCSLTFPEDRALCEQWVNGSKTWPVAMEKSLKTVLEIAKAARPRVLDIIRTKPLAVGIKESINSNCTDAFDTYVFYMEENIGLVNNDPYGDIFTYLLAPMFGYCKDALLQARLSLPEVDQFERFNDILIAIWKTYPLN